jgi:hypothetical protein
MPGVMWAHNYKKCWTPGTLRNFGFSKTARPSTPIRACSHRGSKSQPLPSPMAFGTPKTCPRQPPIGSLRNSRVPPALPAPPGGGFVPPGPNSAARRVFEGKFLSRVWVGESCTAPLSKCHRSYRSNSPGRCPVLCFLSANFHSIVRESGVGRMVMDQHMIYNYLSLGKSCQRILRNGEYAHDRP